MAKKNKDPILHGIRERDFTKEVTFELRTSRTSSGKQASEKNIPNKRESTWNEFGGDVFWGPFPLGDIVSYQPHLPEYTVSKCYNQTALNSPQCYNERLHFLYSWAEMWSTEAEIVNISRTAVVPLFTQHFVSPLLQHFPSGLSFRTTVLYLA